MYACTQVPRSLIGKRRQDLTTHIHSSMPADEITRHSPADVLRLALIFSPVSQPLQVPMYMASCIVLVVQSLAVCTLAFGAKSLTIVVVGRRC